MEEKTLFGDKKLTSSLENKSQVNKTGGEKTNKIKRPGQKRIPRLMKQKNVEQNLSRVETLKRKLSVSEKKRKSKSDTSFNCTNKIPFSQGTTKIYGKSNASTQEPDEKYMREYEMKHGSGSDNKSKQEKIKENSLIQIFQTETEYNGTDEDRDGPEIITICKKHSRKKTKLKMTIHQENSKTNQLLELLSFDLLIPLQAIESRIEDLSKDKTFVQRLSTSGNVDMNSTTTDRHSFKSEHLKKSFSSTNRTSTIRDQSSLKSQSLKSFSSSSCSRILCPSSCSTVYDRSTYEEAKLRKQLEESLSNLDIRFDKDELTSTIAFEIVPTRTEIVFQNCYRQGDAWKKNDEEKTTTSSEEDMPPCQSTCFIDTVLHNGYNSPLTGSFILSEYKIETDIESNSEEQFFEQNITENCQSQQVVTSEIMKLDTCKENIKNHEPEQSKRDGMEHAYVETPTMLIDKDKGKDSKECDDATLEEDHTTRTPCLKNHEENDCAVESNNSTSLIILKDHHDKERNCKKGDFCTERDKNETPISSEDNKNVEKEKNEENNFKEGDDFTLESNNYKTPTKLEHHFSLHNSKETLQKTSKDQNQKEFLKEKNINLNLFISVREKFNCVNRTTDDNNRDKVFTNEGKNMLEVSFKGSNKETKRINITYTSQSVCKLCSEKPLEILTTDSKSKLVVESTQGNTNAGLTETNTLSPIIEPKRSVESEREVNFINAEDSEASKELINSLGSSNGNSYDAGDQNRQETKPDDTNNDKKLAREINNVNKKIVTQYDSITTKEIPSSNKTNEVETKETDASHQNIWTFEIEKSDKRDEEQIEKIDEKVEQSSTNYEGSRNSTNVDTNDSKHVKRFLNLVDKPTRERLEKKEIIENQLNLDIDVAGPQKQYPVLEKKTTLRKMNGLLRNSKHISQGDVSIEQKKIIERRVKSRKKGKPKQICHYIRNYVKYAVEDGLDVS